MNNYDYLGDGVWQYAYRTRKHDAFEGHDIFYRLQALVAEIAKDAIKVSNIHFDGECLEIVYTEDGIDDFVVGKLSFIELLLRLNEILEDRSEAYEYCQTKEEKYQKRQLIRHLTTTLELLKDEK